MPEVHYSGDPPVLYISKKASPLAIMLRKGVGQEATVHPFILNTFNQQINFANQLSYSHLS